MQIFQLALLCTTFFTSSESANILAFPWFPGYSHFIIIEPLLKALAERGHNVTVVGYFPLKTPVKNYHDIDISHTLPLVTNNISIDYALKNMRRPTDFMQFVFNVGHKTCDAAFKDEKVQNLINTTDKYDLVITEVFGADCFTAFAYKFNLPLVSIVTTIGVPWSHQRLANPDNPAYVTNYFLPVKEKMTLYDRFYNAVIRFIANTGYYFLCDIPQHKMMTKYFGESLPPFYEIVKNTSLMMTNSHYSFRQIQPFLPNYVEIGGIHLKAPKPLPKDLQEILDKSSKGVIVLTLGSMLRFSTMPEHVMNAFIKTFTKLPYTVIWKIEDPVQNLPKNVHARKWIPVRDILEHPNVKLLIMHGGMATTIETINAGVPVVGIPMYADQPGNINSLVNKGAAIAVDYYDISEETLLNAIAGVLSNPSFRENSKKLSALFKDRPQNPLETAVYWTEYVLKYNGAYHLQSPAVHLTWYQLMLLDVMFWTIVITTAVIVTCYYVFLIIKRSLLVPEKYKEKKS